MINSMTAFASLVIKTPTGTMTCDMRTVNHRFLDVTLRLPEMLRSFEAQYRDLVKTNLKRGKVDVSFKWQAAEETSAAMHLNSDTLHKLSSHCGAVLSVFPTAQVNALEVLRWPNVMQAEELPAEDLEKISLTLLSDTLTQLKAQRAREGETIALCILEIAAKMSEYRQIILERLPIFLEQQRQNLIERLNELALTLDENRLEQEMLLLLNKIDTAEEMQRLGVHIEETVAIIKRGGVVGRRLDFLMQELNREVNTTASKSIDTTVTKAAVELKVLIEQIREQVQNIE